LQQSDESLSGLLFDTLVSFGYELSEGQAPVFQEFLGRVGTDLLPAEVLATDIEGLGSEEQQKQIKSRVVKSKTRL
jgi:hypothetical protein